VAAFGDPIIEEEDDCRMEEDPFVIVVYDGGMEFAGGFRVGRILGRGAFGEVYHATAPDGTEVAVKKISLVGIATLADREACLKESTLLQRLDHPHIIKCHAVFLHYDEIHIVLEYAGAGDLAHMLKTMRGMKQRFPETYIWKVFSQVAAGLGYMHECRVMHRDIKPANVFLTTDGVVKVADLGLGRYFASKSHTASVVGTPYYMAPERLSACEYSFSSDVWSAGCLLYELAALRSPFHIAEHDQQNLFLLGQKITKGDYPALPARLYSVTLVELVQHCLASDPSDRPTMQSIAECAQAAHEHAATKDKRRSKSSARR
jgi:NIMA (never in mitosis gene a)-related kinase